MNNLVQSNGDGENGNKEVVESSNSLNLPLKQIVLLYARAALTKLVAWVVRNKSGICREEKPFGRGTGMVPTRNISTVIWRVCSLP